MTATQKASTGRPKPYPRQTEAAAVSASPAPAVQLDVPSPSSGPGRRSVLGWAFAAPTLLVGAPLLAAAADPRAASASIPSAPEPADLFDLGDLQDLAALPTSNLITVEVHTDGTASFALPRAEVGQGVTTSSAMLIAEELDLPISKVTVTLADARPELLFNQLTGGSNTTRSTYQAIRAAAALARGQLMQAAAKMWGVDTSALSTHQGVVHGPGGKTATYGSLTKQASVSTLTRLQVAPKATKDFTVIGKAQRRLDARDAVTGRKKFAMDLQVPNALPTMVARPPTINGTPKSVSNMAAVKAMPGVTDVARITHGVAVRAATFGQCIDAIRALKVSWNKGTVDGKSDASVLAELKAAELPLAVPTVPVLAKTVEQSFTFHFRSNTPLETGCAVADYRSTGIEVWGCLKVPIVLAQSLAAQYGFAQDKVKVHVTQGGGSFGRHLFSDTAIEAVEASKAFGKPVKLMWSRTDDFRQGRTHPMATSRIRATYLLGNVLSFEQRHTSVATDFGHGLGEILTAFASKLPVGGNYSFAQSIFELTQSVPYNFGITTQLLNEVGDPDNGFNTGSMRNIYSPDTTTALELVTDQLAKVAGQDPLAFRKSFVKDPRGVAVLDAVAKAGNWGRTMPKGTAQGIAIHNEYKGWCACLVELDTTTAQTGRKIRDAYTGPRVTKVVFAVDVGLTVNPTGLEAQMQGGIMDGIAQTLSSSMHLENGTFLEGSWDDYHYTRQWNVPPAIEVIIMPNTGENPGGAGEFGVAATMAAVACAYARATGKVPTEFPLNHNEPLTFTPFPTVPSTPQSPTNGLSFRY